MLEKELVDMFMGTLQGPYYEKLVGSTSAAFSDLVVACERIEIGVKAGKIPNPANAANGAKKPYSGFPKKKERETNAASTSKGKGKAYETRIIKSQKEAKPPPSPLPPGYGVNARCEFHTGAPSHTLDNCKAFRNVFPGCTEDCARCGDTPQGCEELREGVQMLIDQGIFLVEHSSAANEVSTLEIPYYPVQLPVENAPTTPLVIVVPAPFPYESAKAVPWNYNSTAYLHGRRLGERTAKARKTLVIHVPFEVPEPAEAQKSVEVQEPVVNITGTSGMTRSDRIFAAPPPPPEKENLGTNAKSKGKQPAGPEQAQTQTQGKVMPDDVEEFLRIIKKSDYKVVDQLNQTPSKISILSLLLCSEARRDALLKFISAAHVPQEITVNQFEGVVANIASKGCLGFCDDELPPEGKNHKKALHISIECADTIMFRVLVDTGSSLNVLPKISLTKLTIEGLLMKPSALIVRAFDGSRRSVVGEVDLPIKIGPYTFFATFYVMDIHPAYSCLLGRPWIHAAGAVTSTLHQKLKFIISDKLVTIDGEEYILVSQLSSFRYVEVDGEIHETPFQAFEIANVLMNPLNGRASGKPELPMSSLKDAQTIIKAGHPEGWGRILELPVNKNRSGLGYHPEQATQQNTPIGGGEMALSIPGNFISVGHHFQDQVTMVGEDLNTSEVDCFVLKKTAGQQLHNWTEVDLPEVTFCQT
ncbi:uncharacterized protein LOC127122628 [Lathyrus oleraceus]|uniref:uncharacterized protein LOC127122628 n=1 Tax=Pisum sativum TaxID=3888 RepID=UPI0021CE4D4B|nr:uncharacterized protein LOC127122628 [Pisum sativum]